MLTFMMPKGWEGKTENEFWDTYTANHGDGKSCKYVLEFLEEFRKKLRGKHANIMYKFVETGYGGMGIRPHEVWFYDANYPDEFPIGMLDIESYTERPLCVYHRFNNMRRAESRGGLRAQKTKDMKKAVGMAVKFFKPNTSKDIAVHTKEEVRVKLNRWKAEVHPHRSGVLDPFEPDTIKELQSLVDQGVVFTTDLYKRAVERLPKAIEYMRRMQMANMEMMFVIEHDGLLSLGHYKDNGDVALIDRYTSEDKLPDVVRGKYSLLQMIDDETMMPEVGYRRSEKIRWLFGVDPNECAMQDNT